MLKYPMGFLTEWCVKTSVSEHNQIIDKDLLDPFSKKSYQIVGKIFEKISDGKAMLYDESIVRVSNNGKEQLCIYSEEHGEYRLHDGTYLYVIPRSVVLGRSSLVKRRIYHPKSLIIKTLCLQMKLADFIERKFPDKEEKMIWNGNVAFINKIDLIKPTHIEVPE